MVFTSTQHLGFLTVITLTIGIYRSDIFQSSLRRPTTEKLEPRLDPYEQTLEGVKSLKGDQLQKEQERLEKISKVTNFEEFGVREDQNCNDSPRFFDSPQPRTAISSFPGSGNTWARHLLHMASGYWTGNRRGSNHLKQYGWQGEDRDCKDGTTIAQKTHRLSKNKACKFERGLVIVRNPFEAILAAYNHHKAGKTGEPPYSGKKSK
ncbi:Oidioi.mRNA.OKI2018_I69.PAR.g8755.t1.cds [Oikopleura dioica]|uniref:Oidioi.mRNA.OKI2018_I69.PAR.g8755.t1.cds n=1 Tax=Oikopleura dioica TaxID=34765 RepID=A0ABN7RLX1_OIKDI|nr:Oidioi.mRNA.OKI2018_I69.PAR.g8755.t1.cds [Oikopleura dioica]